MKVINYILPVLLCTGAAVAMDQLTLQKKFALQQKYGQKQQEYVFGEYKIHPPVEQTITSHMVHDNQIMLCAQQEQAQRNVVIAILAWTYNTVTAPFSYVFSSTKKPVDTFNFNWEKPLKLDKKGSASVTVGGGKRYLVAWQNESRFDVFDLAKEERVFSYISDKKITAVDWSNDLTYCAIEEDKSVIKLFDIKTKESKTLERSQNGYNLFWQSATKPEDARFMQCSEKIVVTQLPSFQPTTLQREGHAIISRSHQKNIIGLCYDDKKVIFHDLKNYAPIVEIEGKATISLLYSSFREPRYFVVLVDGYFKAYDIETGKECYSEPQDSSTAVDRTWSLDGTQCYCAVYKPGGEVKVFLHDIKNNRVTQLDSEGGEWYGYQGFSRFGDYVVACYVTESKEEIRLFDTKKEDGKSIKVFEYKGSPRGIFTENDWYIAKVLDNKIEAFDVKKNTSIFLPYDGKNFIFYFDKNYSMQCAALAVNERNLSVFNAKNTHIEELSFRHAVDYKNMTFNDIYGHLVIPCNKQLFIFDPVRNDYITTIDLKGDIKGFEFSPDGKWLLVQPQATLDTLMVYDVVRDYREATKPLIFDSPIVEYRFAYENGEAFCVTTDKSIYAYSLRNGVVLESVELKK